MAVRPIAASKGRWNSRANPIAPPRNSARSVAIAATSLTSHMTSTIRRGKCVRHSSARLRPVTMPILALIAWNSMATALASRTTHSSPYP